jgi:hypothetical protein
MWRPLLLWLLCTGLATPETPAQPGGNTSVESCLSRLNPSNVELEARCVDRILEAGEEPISRLTRRLGLTSVQPRQTIVPPESRCTARVNEVLVAIRFENPSPKPALIRIGGSGGRESLIRARASIRFQTFGFTWDGGETNAQEVEVRLRSGAGLRLCETDEIVETVLQVPIQMEYVGRYRIDLQLEYLGPIAVPERPEPDWIETTTFSIDYLPSGSFSRRQHVCKGNIRIDADQVSSAYFPGDDITFRVKITNVNTDTGDSLLLPDRYSFFGSPLWFVVLGDDDEILASGNVVPLDQMQAEATSTKVATMRLPPGGRLELRAFLSCQLPVGRHTVVIGMTVHRDPGEQGLWIGETVCRDFEINVSSG